MAATQKNQTSIPQFGQQDLKDPGLFKLNNAISFIYGKLATGQAAVTEIVNNIPTFTASAPQSGGGGGTVVVPTGVVLEAANYCGGGGLTQVCINNAIAALPSTGGAIHVKTGTWVFSGPVNCNLANVLIYGDGNGTLITRTSNMPSGQGMFDVTAVGVSIQTMQINGEVTSPTGLLYNTAQPAGFYATNPETGSGNINYPLAATLTENTSIWVHGGANNFTAKGMTITQTGGYAILVDASGSNITNVLISGCTFTGNKPHLFGISSGDINYGSWTGGILYVGGTYQGGAGTLSAVNGLTVIGNTFTFNNGNCVWGYSPQLTVLHSNIIITSNYFQDCGLDGTNPGASQNVVVGDNTYYRIGYINGNPKFLPGANAVAMDTSGFVRSVQYVGNTVFNVNGYGASLDGFTDGAFSGNNISNAQPGDYYYTEDQVASYSADTIGVETSNTYDPRGGQNVSITGNTIKNMGFYAVVLFDNRNSILSGNTIYHPSTALGVPVDLANLAFTGTVSTSGTSVTLDSGDPFVTTWVENGYIYITINGVQYQIASVGSTSSITLTTSAGTQSSVAYGLGQLQNNTVTGNQIFYSGSNICILEDNSDGAVYGPNYIYDNRVLGVGNLGEVGISIAAGATSRTNFILGTNQPFNPGSPNPISQSIFQREGISTTAATKIYSNVAGVGTSIFELTDTNGATLPQIAGPILNISAAGASNSGQLATGARTVFGILTDYAYTGKTIVDGYGVFGIYNTPTTYWDTETNSLTDSYGLLRYTRSGGVGSGGGFEVSVSTSGGSRVWTSISGGGSGSPGGGNTSIQYNNGTGFGGDGNLVWYYNTGSTPPYQQMVLTGKGGVAAYAGLVVTDPHAGTTGDPHVVYIESDGGFYSGLGNGSWTGTGANTEVVNIPNGGVFANTVTVNGGLLVLDKTATTPAVSSTNQSILYMTSTAIMVSQNGSAYTPLATASAAGITSEVQVNSGGAFAAYSTFTYNSGTFVLAVSGSGAYVQSGGFVPTTNSWEAINGATSGAGAYLAGYVTAPYSSTGGYFDFAPLGYANFPVVLAGSSGFGSNDVLLWASAPNLTMTPLTSVALNTNSSINAADGFYTNNSNYNAIQAPNGGVLAYSLSIISGVVNSPAGYVSTSQSGGGFGVYNSNSNSNSRNWGIVSNFAVFGDFAINQSSTQGGNPFLSTTDCKIYIGATGLVGIGTTGPAYQLHVYGSGQVIYSQGGYVGSDIGFYSPYTSYQTVNIPNGGLWARSLAVAKYIEVGQSNGVPTATSGDTVPNNGNIYYDTGSSTLQAYINGAWVSLGSGSGAVSSVSGSGAGIHVSPTTGAVVVSNTGVTSLGSGTGVSVSSSTGAVTVSIGQPVATTSNVTFNTIIVTSSSNPALNVVGGIDCGAIYCSDGNYNAIQTAGGISSGTGSLGGYYLGATQIITNTGSFVATVYDVQGGYFGQDATGGLVCGAHTLYFKGGILYAWT